MYVVDLGDAEHLRADQDPEHDLDDDRRQDEPQVPAREEGAERRREEDEDERPRLLARELGREEASAQSLRAASVACRGRRAADALAVRPGRRGRDRPSRPTSPRRRRPGAASSRSTASRRSGRTDSRAPRASPAAVARPGSTCRRTRGSRSRSASGSPPSGARGSRARCPSRRAGAPRSERSVCPTSRSRSSRWSSTCTAVVGSLTAGDSARIAMSTMIRTANAGSCSIVRSTPSATSERSRSSASGPGQARRRSISAAPAETKSPTDAAARRGSSFACAQFPSPRKSIAWIAPPWIIRTTSAGRPVR